MARYTKLLQLMERVMARTDGETADGILVGPCTREEIATIERVIDPVVLTDAGAWGKHFPGSIVTAEATVEEIAHDILQDLDGFRDAFGPLMIVFVPDQATLDAIPQAVKARLRCATPAEIA